MKTTSGWLAAGALAMALLVSGAARADVVESPPENCPDGATGATCHGGPHCVPDICVTNGDCVAGEVCVPTSLCTLPFDCGFDETIEVVGLCSNGCPNGGSCQTQSVCVSSATTTTTTTTTGSTVSVGPGGAGGGGAGGAGGASTGGGGAGGGNDLVVTGCACSTDGRRTVGGVVGTLLLAVGLAGLAGRRSTSRRKKK